MKYVLALLLALPGLPVSAQTAFTYGDLMTSEEVRVEEGQNILGIAMTRMNVASPKLLQGFAYAAQVLGDGITCDLIMTHLGVKEGQGLTDAANAAQSTCLTWGINAPK